MRAELRHDHQGARQVFPLDAPKFTIGRDAESSLCLADPVVSRYHAELIRLGGDVLLRDLGSTNGTFVNGVRVAERILVDGDTVRFGKAGPTIDFVVIEADVPDGRLRTEGGLIESLTGKLGEPGSDPSEQASLRCVLAEAHLARGDVDAALAMLRPYADPAMLAAMTPSTRASVLLALGRASIERKEYDEGIARLRGVLALTTRGGDASLRAAAQVALGRALTGTGDRLGARDSLHRALLVARRAGNSRLGAEAHLQIGRLDWKEGDIEGARFNWARATRMAEGTTDAGLQARVRLQQAFVLYAEGELAAGAAAYDEAVKMIVAIGNTRLLLKAYATLSRIHTRLGSWVQTERLLEERMRLARETEQPRAEAVALTDLAELRLLQGNLLAARNVINAAVEKLGGSDYARTLRILGRVLAADGHAGEATSALERAMRAAEAKGTLEEEILIGIELALVTATPGRAAEARVHLERAESITPLDPALNLMARALFARGKLHAVEVERREANRAFSQALAIFQTIGDPFRIGLCHNQIGALRAAAGRPSSARAHFEEAETIFARLGAAGELRETRLRLAAADFAGVEAAMTRTLSKTAPLSMANLKPETLERIVKGPQAMRVLVAEADVALAALLSRGLEVENYRIDCVTDGRQALDRVAKNAGRYDLLLVDALLEHRSGFDVCREVRDRQLEVPIVLLGGRQGVEDKIEALQAGADDFVVKRGLVFEELLAKMEALLR